MPVASHAPPMFFVWDEHGVITVLGNRTTRLGRDQKTRTMEGATMRLALSHRPLHMPTSQTVLIITVAMGAAIFWGLAFWIGYT
ncbi:hypothetical protein KGY14_11655 [Ameyamaea chiangmaiensis]|uniref:Uncharacterized protein n=1 Tax=Ameyamaea chiangmaiensis TaxID=442969 RepID=A0A850P8H2_9PROT|nr:hypothetical protein [Ameyamaea chiangmaiensis]MBS4075846.1 hypothetical protein [Ameyamaea chiangmaiensis]NVN39283.1 hypothetical protein [Ameyamaea chiangmaiensis]